MQSSSIGITGMGHALPEKILTNADLERMVDTSDEWITTRTGIKERRIAAADEKCSDLALRAGREALQKSGLKAQEIELIIVATVSPDSNFPAVACLVQKQLGAFKAAAFDVSAACSGFLFAMTTARQYLATGLFRNALVIAAEKITSLIDWNDRGTCVLFGDGAGACVLETVPSGYGILSEHIHSRGDLAELLHVVQEPREPLDQEKIMMRVPYVVMHGQELFKAAVHSMSESVEIAIARAGLEPSQIKCVVPHQANDRIITAVAKKLGFDKDRIFINIGRYGNMSAASIGVALYEAVREGVIRHGDYAALVTFGAGLTAAANVIRWVEKQNQEFEK